MATDHDQIFKNLIEAFFQEFVALFLPKEAKLIDFSRVEFLKQEHFTDVPRGERRRLDLVAKVGLRTGGDEFVLVHGEFEGKKEPDFPKRMYRYFSRLFDRYDTAIVPVAVFTDDAKWRKPIPDSFTIQLRCTYMRFRYHLVKLKHLDYRRFLTSSNPLAYALMAKMGYSRRERVRLKAEFLRLILGAKVDPARRSLLIDFVETYMPLGGQDESEYERLVAKDPEYREVAAMITVYEKRGIEKGRREGKREGKRAGQIQEKRAVLTLQLEKRFGDLEASLKQRIRRIGSPQRLDSLLLAVLDAQSVDDLDL